MSDSTKEQPKTATEDGSEALIASVPPSNTNPGEGQGPESVSDSLFDDVDVSDLLREVFDGSDGARPSGDIMGKVRQTLRQESGGRYFNDAWSSSSHPIRSFMLTSLVMLVVAVLLAILLPPYGLSPLP